MSCKSTSQVGAINDWSHQWEFLKQHSGLESSQPHLGYLPKRLKFTLSPWAPPTATYEKAVLPRDSGHLQSKKETEPQLLIPARTRNAVWDTPGSPIANPSLEMLADNAPHDPSYSPIAAESPSWPCSSTEPQLLLSPLHRE